MSDLTSKKMEKENIYPQIRHGYGKETAWILLRQGFYSLKWSTGYVGTCSLYWSIQVQSGVGRTNRGAE